MVQVFPKVSLSLLYRVGHITLYSPCTINTGLFGLVVRVSGYRSRGPGSIPRPTTFLTISGSGMGPTHPGDYIKGLLERRITDSGLENRELSRMIRHADHVAPSISKSWH
jgi:hypothetical protein